MKSLKNDPHKRLITHVKRCMLLPYNATMRFFSINTIAVCCTRAIVVIYLSDHCHCRSSPLTTLSICYSYIHYLLQLHSLFSKKQYSTLPVVLFCVQSACFIGAVETAWGDKTLFRCNRSGKFAAKRLGW